MESTLEPPEETGPDVTLPSEADFGLLTSSTGTNVSNIRGAVQLVIKARAAMHDWNDCRRHVYVGL